MNLLQRMFFDDSSSDDDDDDDFEMMAILLAGIAMSKQAKHGGSAPRRKVVCRKLFDDYSTDDESMSCAFSSTTASSAATRKKPLQCLAATAGSILNKRLRTRGLVGHAGGKIGVPVMDLPAGGTPPMTRRQKRKAWMQAKLKVKAGTEGGVDPAGPSTRRKTKPNPKYLGPDWVR